MKRIQNISQTLEHILAEVIELKKDLGRLEAHDKEKAVSAWRDLMAVSKKITKRWRGSGAVEEIRQQREKVW